MSDPMSDPLPLKSTMQFEYGVARELRPGIRRIVANNPSPFTFKGTNTYLVGTDELALVDPGPGDPAHLDAIMQAAGAKPIRHILLTHTHHDHFEGLPALQARTGAKTAGHGYVATNRLSGAHAASPTATAPNAPNKGEVVDKSFVPDIVLKDGALLEGRGYTFEAVLTPGHAPDHLCFALEGTGILFSADHVMAWNTSVVAPPEGKMSDYLESLERLRGRGDTLYLPGHGGKLRDPERMVRGYLIHRRMREDSILGAIREKPRSIADIVALIYPSIEQKLVRAASLSVQAHVEHLVERGLVAGDGPLILDRQLYPV